MNDIAFCTNDKLINAQKYIVFLSFNVFIVYIKIICCRENELQIIMSCEFYSDKFTCCIFLNLYIKNTTNNSFLMYYFIIVFFHCIIIIHNS